MLIESLLPSPGREGRSSPWPPATSTRSWLSTSWRGALLCSWIGFHNSLKVTLTVMTEFTLLNTQSVVPGFTTSYEACIIFVIVPLFLTNIISFQLSRAKPNNQAELTTISFLFVWRSQNFWPILSPFSPFCTSYPLFGPSWSLVAHLGLSWLILAIVWLLLAPFGSFWLLLASFGFFWLLLAYWSPY